MNIYEVIIYLQFSIYHQKDPSLRAALQEVLLILQPLAEKSLSEIQENHLATAEQAGEKLKAVIANISATYNYFSEKNALRRQLIEMQTALLKLPKINLNEKKHGESWMRCYKKLLTLNNVEVSGLQSQFFPHRVPGLCAGFSTESIFFPESRLMHNPSSEKEKILYTLRTHQMQYQNSEGLNTDKVFLIAERKIKKIDGFHLLAENLSPLPEGHYSLDITKKFHPRSHVIYLRVSNSHLFFNDINFCAVKVLRSDHFAISQVIPTFLSVCQERQGYHLVTIKQYCKTDPPRPFPMSCIAKPLNKNILQNEISAPSILAFFLAVYLLSSSIAARQEWLPDVMTFCIAASLITFVIWDLTKPKLTMANYLNDYITEPLPLNARIGDYVADLDNTTRFANR